MTLSLFACAAAALAAPQGALPDLGPAAGGTWRSPWSAESGPRTIAAGRIRGRHATDLAVLDAGGDLWVRADLDRFDDLTAPAAGAVADVEVLDDAYDVDQLLAVCSGGPTAGLVRVEWPAGWTAQPTTTLLDAGWAGVTSLHVARLDGQQRAVFGHDPAAGVLLRKRWSAGDGFVDLAPLSVVGNVRDVETLVVSPIGRVLAVHTDAELRLSTLDGALTLIALPPSPVDDLAALNDLTLAWVVEDPVLGACVRSLDMYALSAPLPLGGEAASLAACRVDGDAFEDLVIGLTGAAADAPTVLHYSPEYMLVPSGAPHPWAGVGRIELDAQPHLPPALGGVLGLTRGDLDGDGDEDLVLSHQDGQTTQWINGRLNEDCRRFHLDASQTPAFTLDPQGGQGTLELRLDVPLSGLHGDYELALFCEDLAGGPDPDTGMGIFDLAPRLETVFQSVFPPADWKREAEDGTPVITYHLSLPFALHGLADDDFRVWVLLRPVDLDAAGVRSAGPNQLISCSPRADLALEVEDRPHPGVAPCRWAEPGDGDLGSNGGRYGGSAGRPGGG